MNSALLNRINDFVADSCFLFVLAFVLARGKVLNWMLQPRRALGGSIMVGVVLGLIGAPEPIIPETRYPYVGSTLIAALLPLIDSPIITSVTLLITVGAFAVTKYSAGCWATVAAFCVSFVLVQILKFMGKHSLLNLTEAFLAGALGHSVVFALVQMNVLHHYPASIGSIFANGFGLVIIVFVIRDANRRRAMEAERLEYEQMRVSIRDAQLGALRARIRPHFLFNALTSIAALCNLDPRKAESAIVSLSQIMRRSLDSQAQTVSPLEREIEEVRAYVGIEQLRLGKRLQMEWELEENALKASGPAFAVQTLVENAISHGIAAQRGKGTVRITIRTNRRRVIVGVQDTGLGFDRTSLNNQEAEHGLGILDRQLQLLYGAKHRLRVFSRRERGSLVAFSLPAGKNE